MNVMSTIRSLRIIAFLLFLTPTLALIGSLVTHNTLIGFKFKYDDNYNLENNLPGSTTEKIECNKQNNYCAKIQFEKNKKLNKCNKYLLDRFTLSETGKILDKQILDKNDTSGKNIKKLSEDLNQKIFIQWKISNILNENCILNTSFHNLYKISPFIFEKTAQLKNNKKTSFGTGTVINPILYGEASISNVVKRFPIKWIFKPLMYLSVMLMIIYWYYNNLILNKLQNTKIHNKFFIFGILSSIFLLLHVIFLGWTFESEILTKVRRTLIVFFILFEVLAQAYLIKDIFKIKSEISEYVNTTVVYCKLAFVFFICISTLIILFILLMVNLDHKVDYILEWNYFLILLLFYLLSSMMWRKKN